MTVRKKLMILILFVGLVPLAVGAVASLRLHQKAFDAKVSELHQRLAESGAMVWRRDAEHAARTLLLAARSIAWDKLSPAERRGALALVYRQLDAVAVVTLLDHSGEGIDAGVYVEPGAAPADLAQHPAMSLAALERFAQAIPFAAAQENGSAAGELFASSEHKAPFLPLAFRVSGKRERQWVLAVALSTAGTCHELQRLGSDTIQVYAMDDQGRVACRVDTAALARGDSNLGALLDSIDAAAASLHYARDGVDMLAVAAPTGAGSFVVAEQPVAEAFKSSQRMRLQTIGFLALGLVAALAAGLYLGQGIQRPIKDLVAGAERLAAGEFGHRLSGHGRDEFAHLSRTFNAMSTEIEKRDAELRQWNQELQRRVDERTRELRDVQEQLLESKKIAAVTSLGAGISHELNNPLTSVIGLAQIVAKKVGQQGMPKESGLLQQIVGEASRIKDIVKTLLSLSESYGGDSFQPIDVHALLDDVVSGMQRDLEAAGVRVVREYAPSLPTVLGDRAQLSQVWVNLFANARQAMQHGGALTLSTAAVEGKVVKVTVADSGRGIAPEHLGKIFEPFFTTKEDWHGEGLGLTVVFRIIEQHRGKIQAASTLGRGTTMTIILPAAERRAHMV